MSNQNSVSLSSEMLGVPIETVGPAVLKAVKQHLEDTVGTASASRTNTWLLKHVVEPGDPIGPRGQEKPAIEHTIVGFIDDHPHANWEHPCRHVHYRAADGAPTATLPAHLPPVMRHFADHHLPVTTPVAARTLAAPTPASPPTSPGSPAPDNRIRRGDRHAIIFAGGIPDPRHLHDAELCWRLLVEAYRFDPANIQVLNYNGNLEAYNGDLDKDPHGQPKWPGDNSHFRMKIDGPGTRPGFQQACASLKGRIQPDDLLFLFMGNHGGYDHRGSSLLVQDGGTYLATDLAADLKTVPMHRALIAVMQQCHSGGFVTPILQATTATQASVAAACKDTGLSHHCGDWDPFAVNWIQATWGMSCPYQPYPSAPNTDADTNGDHVVTTNEAFDYCAARNKAGAPLPTGFGPDDGPFLRESKQGAASDLSLDQQYAG